MSRIKDEETGLLSGLFLKRMSIRAHLSRLQTNTANTKTESDVTVLLFPNT